jgi:hypothetical protein
LRSSNHSDTQRIVRVWREGGVSSCFETPP